MCLLKIIHAGNAVAASCCGWSGALGGDGAAPQGLIPGLGQSCPPSGAGNKSDLMP